MACNDFSKLQPLLNSLIEKRKKLKPRIINLSRELTKKYCKDDQRAAMLGQTAHAWVQLKKKIKMLQEFFATGGDVFDESTVDKDFQKKQDYRISQAAKSRAQEFINGFIEQSIIQPMYAERSQINSNLRSLPNKNNRFVTSRPMGIGEMFNAPKDENSKDLLSSDTSKSFEEEITAESIEEEVSEEILKSKEDEQDDISFNDRINTKKKLEQKIEILTTRIIKELEEQEKTREFSEAYSESIVNSFQPFHQTLRESESIMKQKTGLLEGTVSRQNVSVY